MSPVGVFPGSKCIPAGLPQCPLASRAVQHLGNPSDCVLPMISCCRGMRRTFPVRSDGQISLPFPSLSLRRCPSYAAGKQSRRAALRRTCQELGPQPGASLCLLKVTQSGISRACPWPCEVCFVRAVWCWSCRLLWGSLLAPVAPRCLRALRGTLLPAQSPSRGKPCAVSWEVLGGWLLLFWCLSAPTWPRQGTVQTAAMGRHVAGARVEERRGKHLKIRAISMLGDVESDKIHKKPVGGVKTARS